MVSSSDHHKAKKALDFSYFLEHPSKLLILLYFEWPMFQMQLASRFNLVPMAFEII